MQSERKSQRSVDELAAVLARALIGLREGDRVPTVRTLARTHHASLASVHAALARLRSSGAVTVEQHGRSGSFVTERSLGKLWRHAEQTPLVIGLPLPSALRFEGLATGLKSTLVAAGVEAFLIFIRGSRQRLQALRDHRCHIAVMSTFAAGELLRHTECVLADLPEGTFVTGHRRFVRAAAPAQGPLRVLVDRDSLDQQLLTELEYADQDVEWLPASYVQLARLLGQGRADATVWTADEMAGRLPDGVLDLPLSARVQARVGTSDTRACLVARTTDLSARAVVIQGVGPAEVVAAQQDVIAGRTVPEY